MLEINKVHCGDCLDVMSNIPDGSIDMVMADPPYGTTQCKWDSIIPLEPMWNHLNRVIKPNGAIILMAQTPFDKILGASNLPMLKYEWICEKTSATGFFNAKKMPMKAHENALVFYDNLPTYNPQITTGHERKTATKRLVGSDCYGKAFKTTYYDSTKRYPRSVQVFSSDKQKSNLHPTQKPVAMMEYFIKTYTNSGDTILDFSAGSGTTAVACCNLHRNFILIEKYLKYCEISNRRIANAEPHLFLLQ